MTTLSMPLFKDYGWITYMLIDGADVNTHSNVVLLVVSYTSHGEVVPLIDQKTDVNASGSVAL
jgi:hypothetical protein